MFMRRTLAALLVAFPTVAVGIVVMRWMPLPNPLNVQWSGTEVTNTQPLWMFFLPIAALTLVGFAMAMAIAAAVDRDHEDPYRGMLYIAAVLTAGVLVCACRLSRQISAMPHRPARLSSARWRLRRCTPCSRWPLSASANGTDRASTRT